MTSRNEWVALKILAARDEQANPRQEIGVLRELSAQAAAGQAYVVQLLDDFHHAGPNGQHKILVLSLLGPSLAQVIASCNYTEAGETPTTDNRLDAYSILRVARQLLSTLVVMHQKGIAHGGKNLSSMDCFFSICKSPNNEIASLTHLPNHRYQFQQYCLHCSQYPPRLRARDSYSHRYSNRGRSCPRRWSICRHKIP